METATFCKVEIMLRLPFITLAEVTVLISLLVFCSLVFYLLSVVFLSFVSFFGVLVFLFSTFVVASSFFSF